MSKLVYLSVVLLWVWSVAACASPTQAPSVEPIKPGDKIGDFLVTTGDEADAANSHELNCSKQGEGENYSCNVSVGTNLNVSNGIYDDQYSGKLDEIWSNHTYEMTINDRPVDLEAFGSVDFQHPTAGAMRHWNVVVVADKPGEITVHSKGTAGGDPFEDTTTFVFSAP
jgi:hypothetical protein